MSNKMQWTKPQLIVLARGTPEEAVLTACKYIVHAGDLAPGAGSPSSVTQDACNRSTGGSDKNCGACQARSGS